MERRYVIQVGKNWYGREFYEVTAESKEEAMRKYEAGQATYVGEKVDDSEENGFVACE